MICIFSRLTDELLAEVTAKSDYIISALKEAKGVKSISGMGLMLGIETEKPVRRENDANNHIHTIYSFSPYSPTKAAYMAYKKIQNVKDHSYSSRIIFVLICFESIDGRIYQW